MKSLFLALLLIPHFVFSDVSLGSKNVSFMELLSNQYSFDKQNLVLTGYVEIQDNIIFLCFNKETCLANGKERVILELDISDKRVRAEYAKVNQCYAKVEGLFHSLRGSSEKLNFIGHMTVNTFPSFASKKAFELCDETR
jgi:hypothetical protein